MCRAMLYIRICVVGDEYVCRQQILASHSDPEIRDDEATATTLRVSLYLDAISEAHKGVARLTDQL